jgi:ribonuclease-3
LSPSEDVSAAADALAARIGCRFSDLSLLETALTHPSHSHETGSATNNERLEFLGDAVLDLIVSEILFAVHPEWDEGDLSRTRAALVNGQTLAECARRIGLGDWIRLGRTEQRSDGANKASILANAFEALVGALYLDSGLAPVEALVRDLFKDALKSDAARQPRDAKTEFQEWAHARFAVTPRYRTVADSGTDDADDRFTVEVEIEGETWGRGIGRSKRNAERAAASAALERSAADDG